MRKKSKEPEFFIYCKAKVGVKQINFGRNKSTLKLLLARSITVAKSLSWLHSLFLNFGEAYIVTPEDENSVR